MALLALIAGATALPPVSPLAAPEPVAVAREAFGIFEFVEWNVPQSLLTYHAVRDGVRLTLSRSDGDYRISLSDNGAVVALEVRAPGCGGAMRHLRYRGRVGEPALFEAMQRFIASLPEGCRLPSDRHAVFVRQIRTSRLDFVRGVQHMKARADVLLGGWRVRCAPRPARHSANGPIIEVPSPHDPCL